MISFSFFHFCSNRQCTGQECVLFFILEGELYIYILNHHIKNHVNADVIKQFKQQGQYIKFVNMPDMKFRLDHHHHHKGLMQLFPLARIKIIIVVFWVSFQENSSINRVPKIVTVTHNLYKLDYSFDAKCNFFVSNMA